MKDLNLINNSLLNNDDKELLKNMILTKNYPNNVECLSIFSKMGKKFNNGNYDYTQYNGDFYYAKHLNIWIDSDLKLLPYSNWWFETFLEQFLIHINMYINFIKNINIKHAISVEGKYMSICKWFITYGHFLDEMFCLKEFQMKNSAENLIPFISFNLPNNNMYNNKNYSDICNILFDKYYDPNNILLTKVNNIILIRHLYNDITFHSFPNCVSDYICEKICLNKNEDVIAKNALFITRNIIPIHMPRCLKNHIEIENYLSNKNVNVFNPEMCNFIDLIKIIKQYKKIIITWGSALTNLCFCNENSEIIILKSESYKHESIKLFNKIIKNKSLNIKIIESIDNIINPEVIIF